MKDLRQILLNIRWNPKLIKERSNIEILIEYRNAPLVEKTILFSTIEEIKKRFIVINIDSISTYIPFHRIKRIINNKTNKIFYQNVPK